MLMGVSASAAFSNMIDEVELEELTDWYAPILGVSLLTAIVDLGAPLDYHLILGAGLYTFVYIAARAFGKYFGARFGATVTHMPKTVCRYLGAEDGAPVSGTDPAASFWCITRLYGHYMQCATGIRTEARSYRHQNRSSQRLYREPLPQLR